MARSTASASSFAQLGAILAGYNSKPAAPAFVVTNEKAAVRLSDPMQIVAVHYDELTREIRVVGEDKNVRVCKIERLKGGVEQARKLWVDLIEAKNSTHEVQFMAAGGFSPDKWFYDIKG